MGHSRGDKRIRLHLFGGATDATRRPAAFPGRFVPGVVLALAAVALVALGAGRAEAQVQGPATGAQSVAGAPVDFTVRGRGPAPSNPSAFVPDAIYVAISSVPVGANQFIALAGPGVLQIRADYVGQVPAPASESGVYVARWTPSINQAPGTYWWQAQTGFSLLDATRTVTLLANPAGVAAPRGLAPADGAAITAGPNVTFSVESPAVASSSLEVRVSRTPALGPDGTLAVTQEAGLPYPLQAGRRTVSGTFSDHWQAGTSWFTSAGGKYIQAGTYYWQPVQRGPIPLDADGTIPGPVYRFTVAHPSAAIPSSAVQSTDGRCGPWKTQVRSLGRKLTLARRAASRADGPIAKRRARARVKALAAQRSRLVKQVATRCR